MYTIEHPIYHPKEHYNWERDEMGIGLNEKFFHTNDYLEVKVDHRILEINKFTVWRFCEKHPLSENWFGNQRILVFPIGDWGKELNLIKEII